MSKRELKGWRGDWWMTEKKTRRELYAWEDKILGQGRMWDAQKRHVVDCQSRNRLLFVKENPLRARSPRRRRSIVKRKQDTRARRDFPNHSDAPVARINNSFFSGLSADLDFNICYAILIFRFFFMHRLSSGHSDENTNIYTVVIKKKLLLLGDV